MFEVFEHTADVGLRIRAASFEALLVEAARGLTSLMVSDLSTIQPRGRLQLRIVGNEPDYLLFDWLNELLYRFDAEHWLGCEFAVTLDPDGLSAEVAGEPFDPARHPLEHEVKAITYHQLRVEQDADGWWAEVIVDI